MLTKDDVYGLMVEALGEVEEMLDLYCNNSGVDPTYVLPVVRRALVATELVGETRTEHNDRQITEAFDGLRLQLAAASREEDKRCISYDRTLSLDQVRELHDAGGCEDCAKYLKWSLRERAAESLRREAAESYCGDVHGEE